MSLRARLTLLAAAAVAAAVALASVAAFLITRAELRHQVDTSLVRLAQGLSAVPEQLRLRLFFGAPEVNVGAPWVLGI